jgi:hypothetical protein
MAIFENDPFGDIKKDAKPVAPEPREVSIFHSRSDVDSSTLALHHTIGIKHTQSSAGDHVHDGISSRKIGTGLGLSVTGARGGNAALTNLLVMLSNIIDFEDNTTA